MLNRHIIHRANPDKLEKNMREHIAHQLRERGFSHTKGGVHLRNATYQELKWTLALELARLEE